MNRRNVLIGLGVVAAGGGAALGTGAFSSVEANRSVTVSTTSDSGALLSLAVGNSNYASTETGDSAGEDVVSINITSVNDDAETRIDGVFTIENSSADGNNKWLYVQSSGAVDGNIVDFRVSSSNVTSGGGSIIGSNEAIELAPSDGQVPVDVVVNANQGDPNIDADVTIRAQDGQP